MSGALVFLILPLATLVFWSRRPAPGWREAVVWAALAWGGGLMVFTEELSLFGALRHGPVLTAWILADAIVAVVAWRTWRRCGWPGWPAADSWFERTAAAALGVLLTLALITAVASPPNTPDALSYHLPRQLMWLQQGSLAHFVTVDDRALMMPPFAEIIQAHAMLLSGGDGWANLPQWLAYGLGMIVASLLARELGAGRRAQWLAALVFATLPMAWHEASSAKNDLLVAVWLGIFCWLALRLVRAERPPAGEWLAAGAALGLALATKTTALVFGFPAVILLARTAWKNLRGAGVLAAAVLLIAGPHYARNLAWYGTPLGIHRAEDGGAQGNEDFSWRAVLSNVARNTTLHLATPSPAVNTRIEAAVARLHRWIGQDLNDPRTTLWILGYTVAWAPQSEPVAGAPVQWLLAAAVALWLLTRGPWRGAPMQALAIAGAGALLYCVALKWQPWGARLHLPAFVVFAALIAWAAEKAGAAGLWLAAAGVLAGWLPAAETDVRPLWSSPTVLATSRWENYFRTQPTDRLRTESCLRAIATAKIASLQIVTHHGFPYPLMRRYLEEAGASARFWGELPAAATLAPEGVLLMDEAQPLPLYLRLPNSPERFRAAGATDPFGLYLPESRARTLARDLPLPRFVGWDRSRGLGLLESGRPAVRRMLAPEMQFTFSPEAAHLTLHLEVTNPSDRPCELEVRCNGRRVAAVRFDPSGDTQIVEVPLSPAAGRCELVLAASGSQPPPLRFAALQIVD